MTEVWGCKYGQDFWIMKGCSPMNPKPWLMSVVLERINVLHVEGGTCKDCEYRSKLVGPPTPSPCGE